MRADPFRFNGKFRDRLFVALVFAIFAGVMWLFAGTYYEGIVSPLTSLRHLRNVIVVQDQLVGPRVVVSYAALSEPAFVVLKRETAASDEYAAVSRLIPEGEAHTFGVGVENGTVPGFYYASLRRDDGDGRFDPAKDAVMRDKHGAAVITRFLVFDVPAR